MSLFGDNPFGASVLDNAGVVEPCEEDCKPLPDYSRHTLEELQRIFKNRKRRTSRERLGLLTAVESRLKPRRVPLRAH